MLALEHERLALCGPDGAVHEEADQLEVVVEEQGVRPEVQLEPSVGPALGVEREGDPASSGGEGRRQGVEHDLGAAGAGGMLRGSLEDVPRRRHGRGLRQLGQVTDEVVDDALLDESTQASGRRERGEVAEGRQQRDDADDNCRRG